mmetsp:Transcript_10500/g.64316  ORF Transcript_10500/g.64316 Transcript_10500/m.64316 type:complete len:103 (-) Transcript_10500:1537-1845(-)
MFLLIWSTKILNRTLYVLLSSQRTLTETLQGTCNFRCTCLPKLSVSLMVVCDRLQKEKVHAMIRRMCTLLEKPFNLAVDLTGKLHVRHCRLEVPPVMEQNRR